MTAAAAPRVAVQGDPGCFSHAAAVGHFGQLELVPCHDFAELFDAVEQGRADYACVPVENALAGAVTDTLDLLAGRPVQAVAEAYVRVEMCLAMKPGTGLDDLLAVGSHPVALKQCRRFLRSRPEVEEIVARDTAGSIRDLMQDPEVRWNGAIGPALACELYGAELVARGIEDHVNNFTRFLMVVPEGLAGAAEEPGEGVAAKASLAFTLPHTPGSLHGAIGIFAEAGLDLTRLQSRPIPGRPWEYRFFADVRGATGPAWDGALDRLRAIAPELRVLGRYAEAPAP